MRRMVWFVMVLTAAFYGNRLFRGADVAKLQPVEVIRLSLQEKRICVQTDTGQMGLGQSLDEAFENLKETTSGHIFLDTAEYVILTSDTAAMTSELMHYLRPACRVCQETDTVKLEAVAAFLDAHEPPVTLMECQTGQEKLPQLIVQEGRMELVS